MDLPSSVHYLWATLGTNPYDLKLSTGPASYPQVDPQGCPLGWRQPARSVKPLIHRYPHIHKRDDDDENFMD